MKINNFFFSFYCLVIISIVWVQIHRAGTSGLDNLVKLLACLQPLQSLSDFRLGL